MNKKPLTFKRIIFYLFLIIVYPIGICYVGFLILKNLPKLLKLCYNKNMLYFVVGFLIFSFVFTGVNDFIREQDRAAKERERAELIETEKGRDYYISFNNLDYLDEDPVIEINCELSPAREASESEKYPGESQPLICQESEEITGVFSKYDSTELKIDYLETSADIDYDKFKFILKGLTFSKYSWETDEANFDELKNIGKEQPLILSIKNNILDEETLRKAIKIRYIFSDRAHCERRSRKKGSRSRSCCRCSQGRTRKTATTKCSQANH